MPAKYVGDLDQECRVLGWDWGVRSLITVSILEKPDEEEAESYRQISRPVFLDTGGLDGRQPDCAARSTVSAPAVTATSSWSE